MDKVTIKHDVTVIGVSLGSVLAVVLSWDLNQSLLYAFIHGILSWIYVIYYMFIHLKF